MFLTRFILLFFPDSTPIVLSGQRASIQLIDTISQFGQKNVLLVTDSVLIQLGVVTPIEKALHEKGVNYVIFDKVKADPSFDIVDAGLAVLKKNQCDSVLAVGGGSSIDTAKVIALSAGNGQLPRRFKGIVIATKPALPLFAVPTTAGTGSEVTAAAVISDVENNRKEIVFGAKIVPLAVALDAAMTAAMPPLITAVTGMDALTHAVEAYISKAATVQTDVYAVTAARMIIVNLETAYTDGNNMAARDAMCQGSFYAGMAFTRAFVGYVHAIAHQLGAKYHTAHGLANAMVLPHVLAFSKDKVGHRLACLALKCGLGELGESNSTLAQRFIDKVWLMNEVMGIPKTLDTLRECDIAEIAKAALHEAHYTYPVPKYMHHSQCCALLQKLLSK